MTGQEAHEAATSPNVDKKVIDSESVEKPSETQHLGEQQQQQEEEEKHEHVDGETTREETTPPTSEEDAAVAAAQAAADAHYTDNGTGPGDASGRPKLPRPTGIVPCLRCCSIETKFCYYNNYNIKQPRYYCKGCQRYWTAGGTFRDVPVGAGRRRTKGARSQDDTLSRGGFSAGSLPSYVDPTLAAITMAAAAAGKPSTLIPPPIPRMLPPMIPPVIPGLIPPGIIPTLPFPTPVDFSHLAAAAAAGRAAGVGDSFTKATANALLTDPLASAFGLVHPVATKTNGTVNQKSKISEASEDEGIEGQGTKRKITDADGDGNDPSDKKGEEELVPGSPATKNDKVTNHVASKQGANGGSAVPAGNGLLSATAAGAAAAMPMHVPPYSVDWFAAQQNPQVAVAMQAQFQAAAAAGYGASAPYAVPAAMWPGYGYGAFPPAAWPNPAAYAAAYTAHENGGGCASADGTVKQDQVQIPVQPVAIPGMAWPAAQWPAMMMPPYAMPPGVALPGNGFIPPVVTPVVAGAGLPATTEATPSVNNNINNKDPNHIIKTNNTSDNAA